MISDAAIAEFDAMEAIADRTLDWSQIGQEVRFIQDAHDLVLAAYKEELAFMSRYCTSYERHELRALWWLITDEQRARSNGKIVRFMTVNERTRESMQRRCEAIRERVPMADFLERECGIHPRRMRNRYSCLCPVHADTHPSFTVFENVRGKCWSCGWSGDVISLAQAVWGLARPVEAIRRLERW